MLKLITGRSGSGKTQYVRQILAEEASRGNSRLMLIVPEQYSFDTERAMITLCGPKNALNIEVLSFTRLSDFVFRDLGISAAENADEGVKIIIMMRALDAVKDKLEQYARHTSSVQLAEQLISTAAEFEAACITPENLRAAASAYSQTKPNFSAKLTELSMIYETYSALLSEKFSDAETRSEKLVRIFRETDFLKGYTIAVDGFKGFTGIELQIIEQFLTGAENVYMTLTLDRLRCEDPSMIWNSISHTAFKVTELARKNSIRVYDLSRAEDFAAVKQGLRYKSADLAVLEDRLFVPSDTPRSPASTDISLISAMNLYDECRFIAATIKHLMRENNVRCSEIAVIVRDEELYRRELYSAFKKYGIPFFEDSRQPVYSQPVICYIRTVLALMTSGGFTAENFLQYMKTGLTELDNKETAVLENYIYMWNLKGSDLKKPFTANPEGLGVKDSGDSLNALELINSYREKLVTPLLRLKRELTDASFAGIGKALYAFMQKSNVPDRLKALAVTYNEQGFTSLANEQNRVYELLMEIFDKLAVYYGDGTSTINRYSDMFNAVIEVTDLGSIPSGLDTVVFGQADRIRLSSPKIVFAAGAAEGKFPAVIGGSGLFTKAEKKLLLEQGLELTMPDTLKASEERYIAYMAVSAPSEKLYVSYHRISPDNEANTPSEIINSILDIFENEIISTDSFPSEYYVESTDSLFSEYARTMPKTDSDSAALSEKYRAVLESYSEYAARVGALDRTVRHDPFRIASSETATKLFGKDMYLSASRVDKYYHCPFQYFCRYGIMLKPRKTAELDPAQSGTAIHYVLEQLLKSMSIDAYIAMDEDARRNHVSQWLDTYLEERMGGRDTKTKRFMYVYNAMAKTLFNILDRLCDEFKNSDFRPRDMELGIGDDKPVRAYELPLSDGGTLKIHGSVDRVDTYEDPATGQLYIKVVDYKTGGKQFNLSDVIAGLNMQMLIYLFAIQECGTDYYGANRPAGIYYYQAKTASFSASYRGEANESNALKATNSENRGNGLFLEDEHMLNAMEHNLSHVYIPVEYSNNGKLKSSDSLLKADELGKLKKKLDQLLIKMAEDLHQGGIEALPAYNTGAYKDTCRYCDYQTVCKFEDGEVRNIEKYKKSDILKILDGEKPDGGDCDAKELD